MSFAKFTARTYIGKDKHGGVKSVLITRKTPQYVYYTVDNEQSGRTLLKTDCYGECIKITKCEDLYISAANPFN